MLSLIGKGRTSTVMATAAPAKAYTGGTKKVPARKAKKKPATEPSQVLPLLNGKASEINPPKIEAALSPRQNIAIAPPAAILGNSNRVVTMPIAKYNGAAANP